MIHVSMGDEQKVVRDGPLRASTDVESNLESGNQDAGLLTPHGDTFDGEIADFQCTGGGAPKFRSHGLLRWRGDQLGARLGHPRQVLMEVEDFGNFGEKARRETEGQRQGRSSARREHWMPVHRGWNM